MALRIGDSAVQRTMPPKTPGTGGAGRPPSRPGMRSAFRMQPKGFMDLHGYLMILGLGVGGGSLWVGGLSIAGERGQFNNLLDDADKAIDWGCLATAHQKLEEASTLQENATWLSDKQLLRHMSLKARLTVAKQRQKTADSSLRLPDGSQAQNDND